MSTNVLFLNPPFHPRFSREQRSPAVTKSDTLYYPKWLAHAAGVAIRERHNVDLLDAPAAKRDIKYVLDRIEQKSIKAVICDTSTPSINNDLKVAEQIKAKFPRTRVLMVGRHVSVVPEETLRASAAVDAIAVREYEYTVRDWLLALGAGGGYDDVLGLVWRNSQGEVIRNKERAAIANLDELPFVSEVYKRFLKIEDYFYGHSLHPLVVFDTSRGCPYKCSFCVYPQTFSGHNVRFRSVNHVADEFDFVARELPQVKTVMLEDDTFIVNKKRTIELADELIRRGNKLPFDSNCRADVGEDVEFFRTLKRAGARLFCVGFESGDPTVIDKMQKNLMKRKNNTYHADSEQFVRNCKEAGIMVHGCFMVGNLNETKASMAATLDFAKRLRPDTAQFFPIMVYPGTAAYREAKEKGYLSTENYSEWLTPEGLHNSVVNLPNITQKELVEFCDDARKKFYLNPKYIAYKVVQSLKSPAELQRNLHGFKSLSKYLWKGSFGRTAAE